VRKEKAAVEAALKSELQARDASIAQLKKKLVDTETEFQDKIATLEHSLSTVASTVQTESLQAQLTTAQQEIVAVRTKVVELQQQCDSRDDLLLKATTNEDKLRQELMETTTILDSQVESLRESEARLKLELQALSSKADNGESARVQLLQRQLEEANTATTIAVAKFEDLKARAEERRGGRGGPSTPAGAPAATRRILAAVPAASTPA